MVQETCQRVPSRRFQELGRLAGDPALGGPEDQEQEGRHDRCRGEGHQHDLAAHGVETGEDRRGVAPQGDDRLGAILGVQQRQVLAEQARLGDRAPDRFARFALAQDRGLDLAGDTPGERVGHLGRLAVGGSIGRDDDATVRRTQLDAEEVAALQQTVEVSLDGLPPGLGHRRLEIARGQEPIDEGADRRRVATDRRVQRRRGEVHGDHRGLRGRGDADDDQEDAVDGEVQDRARDARPGTEQGASAGWVSTGTGTLVEERSGPVRAGSTTERGAHGGAQRVDRGRFAVRRGDARARRPPSLGLLSHGPPGLPTGHFGHAPHRGRRRDGPQVVDIAVDRRLQADRAGARASSWRGDVAHRPCDDRDGDRGVDDVRGECRRHRPSGFLLGDDGRCPDGPRSGRPR